MNFELFWGLPVIFYLFLAGVGAGALTVSSSVLLRGGGGPSGAHVDVARYGAFLAPLPVIIGCGLLVFELGSFQAGNWLKWLNLYKVINLSPMSIGTWLLTFVIFLSLAYAYTFLPNPPVLGKDNALRLRRPLAWLNVPLGAGVAVYTGVLLGAMPARPFWNSPILALLFLLSALSTGVAVILLARALLQPKDDPDDERQRQFDESGYLLAGTDILLIGIELVIVFLFIMFAYLTVGDVRYAIAVILAGGELATLFWLGFIVLGLVLPALVELRYIIPRLLYRKEFSPPRGIEILVPIVVLIGGFVLRYIVVVAGQITGPVGI
jgi:formate-dependent nitrite reductase membrane component NrfD